MQNFIFGGNTGMDYEKLKKQRALAAQLARGAASSSPRNVGEGLSAIGKALAYRALSRKGDAMQEELLAGAQGDPAKAKILKALSGGGGMSALAGGEGADTLGGNEGRFTGYQPYQDEPFSDFSSHQRLMEQEINGMSPDQLDSVMQGFQPEPVHEMMRPAPQAETVAMDQYDPASQARLRANPEDMAADPIDPRELIGGAGDMALDGGEGGDQLRYGDEKMTGDQSKAIAYYRRGFGANQTLSDPKMAQSLTQYTDSFAGNFGAVGRAFQDADYQVANRAAQEFLAAILRKDTGAAITSQEFELYGPMYLPMPGDKPELLAAKAKAREEALTAIEMGLGTAAPLAAMVRDELTPKDTGATHRFNPVTGEIEEIK